MGVIPPHHRCHRYCPSVCPGWIPIGFTGIDDPYEAPVKPELVLDAGKKEAEALADEVIAFLARTGKIR